MATITFHCRVITPMFLAGADGRTPELRAPSIKGAMRFWWRACNGHLVAQTTENTWDYSKLKALEGEIFGNTEKKSSFSIQTRWESRTEGQLPLPKSGIKINVGRFENDIFEYMTYGLWDHKSPSNNRKFVGPGSEFIITLHLHNVNYKKDILQSLYCLIQFGGIGSKARNGFGSFIVAEKDLLNPYAVSPGQFATIEPRDYSCFSKKSEIHSIKYSKSWMEALASALDTYVSVKNITNIGDKNFIAAHDPKRLNLERKPKFCFYKVWENENNLFESKVIFLPYILPAREPQHLNALNAFIEETKKN
ncbi:MAG: type III-B CRISPR module RAMP protein Cmr1 [Phaeodactylibacter sp.]|nr:type III-B CRISPR module RAMP protein Cmr1 [Phaeodactylibacter sp.]